MENKKIILLAADGNSTRIIFHHLSHKFTIHTVLLEHKENKKTFIKRRIKKLGWWKVAGQIAFRVFMVKWLNITSAKRTRKIIEQYHLNINPIPVDKLLTVDSINDDRVASLMKEIQPDAVIVNGTRIISKKILTAINCPFINTHTGITPMYRGVHGGYWALVNDDKNNCGVTIHLVNDGIDTGNILYQKKISPAIKDNFVTYPLLQTAAALELLTRAIKDALEGQLQPQVAAGPSALWYHPTIGQYIYNRIFRKVK